MTLDSSTWTFGDGIVAGLGSAVAAIAGAWATMRHRRQQREERIAERVYSRLEVENKDLRARVERAEARSARALVIEMGLRIMVQDALKSPTIGHGLKQVAILLRALPVPASSPEWDDLLTQIDERDCEPPIPPSSPA